MRGEYMSLFRTLMTQSRGGGNLLVLSTVQQSIRFWEMLIQLGNCWHLQHKQIWCLME
nr:MAG TPA: hypothetical protein [Caudoviricetes sp.]